MEIILNLQQAFYPGCSDVDNACALRALLDSMVSLDLAYLRYHAVAPLYASGVVYGRTRIWEPTCALYLPNKHSERIGRQLWWSPLGEAGGEQRGDCKSLATCRIAELRAQGKSANPVFRFKHREDGSGFLDFHILVQNPETATGWEDPSAQLGMGKDEIAWFYR